MSVPAGKNKKSFTFQMPTSLVTLKRIREGTVNLESRSGANIIVEVPIPTDREFEDDFGRKQIESQYYSKIKKELLEEVNRRPTSDHIIANSFAGYWRYHSFGASIHLFSENEVVIISCGFEKDNSPTEYECLQFIHYLIWSIKIGTS
ncbi:MAG: hypothetical protein KF824_00665 [Fimbriimonadaceae bacterium]|nr:MAG: hypothetical protein KF824_00665 [Fimbriimonadaceae bacterium]